jgi:hypothetical protein
VLGGYYKKLQRPSQNLSLGEVWSFNIKAASWNYLGKLPPRVRTDVTPISLGERLLIFKESSFAEVLNPSENTITTYQIAHDGNRGLTYKNSPTVNPKLKSFYADGWFYLLEAKPQKSPNPEHPDLYFRLVSESDFLSKPIDVEPLYTAPQHPWKTAGTLLTGAVILGGWVIYRQKLRKRDKVLVQGNTLVYKRQVLALDATSISVLTLLLRKGGEASSQEVMEIIENPGFSEGHNLKLKNQIVDSLNLRLKTFLGADEDIIQIVRSATDRRNKSYTLNNSKFKFHG